VLERVVDLLRVQRRRDPKEAGIWATHAYARMILADAFARIGNRDRCEALAHDATEGLERALGDEIARFLLAAFAARRAQALVPAPRRDRLPASVETARAGLDRVQRYKVDRMLESCHTLLVEPGSLDAIDAWIKKSAAQPLTPASRGASLRALTPGARADQIATLVGAGDEPDRRIALAALVELEPDVAFPVLGPIVEAARTASPELCSLACFAAGRFGYRERVPQLLPRLIAAIDDALPPETFCAIVYPLLRALRWLALDSELEALVRRVQRELRLAGLPVGPRLILAGALAALDDPAGTALFDAAVAALPEGVLKLGPLAAVRALAIGATYAGPRGQALLARLEPIYARVTDDFGTNTHFCISVLYFIDALAIAHVDHFLATANVLDPEIEPLFASGLVA
jgi:hypothetical protein